MANYESKEARAEVSTGEIKVWRKEPLGVRETRIGAPPTAADKAALQQMYDAQRHMTWFTLWWHERDSAFVVDAEAGFMRFRGDKSEAEARQALRRAGFSAADTRAMLKEVKGG